MITIFGKKDCPACSMAKEFLKAKGENIEEVDIENAPNEIIDFIRENNIMEIPIIKKCDEKGCKTIIGFNPSDFE